MFSRGLRQFYIDEVGQLDDDTLVIPRNLIVRGDQLCADCNIVNITPVWFSLRVKVHSFLTVLQNGWKIEAGTRSIPSASFKWNYHDVIARIGAEIQWTSEFCYYLFIAACSNPVKVTQKYR